MSIDGFSMSALASELNRILTGGRIDKIFQPNNMDLLIWIRQPGDNIKLLISANPMHARVCITEDTPVNPVTPPAFCMLLRKHLEDGRISGVRQQGRDRILILDVDTRGDKGLIVTKTLIFEIMGKHSNIILLQDNVIIDAVKRVGPALSRHRQVLPGREYLSPPGQHRLDPLAVNPEDLIACWQKAEFPLMQKVIIASLDGTGPVSAREFLHRADLPLNILQGDVTAEKQFKLAEEIVNVATALKSGDYQPTVVSGENGSLSGIAAFPLRHLCGDFKSFPTMSEAIEYADKLKGIQQPPEKQLLAKLLATEIAKLARKTSVLRQDLDEAQNAGEYREKADIIMAYLYQITAGSAEVSLPNLYHPEGPLIQISLDVNQSPVENANSYYQKYNKFKRAQESISSQLTQTEQEIVYLEGLAVSLDHALTQEDINEIRQELANAGYLKIAQKKRSSLPPAAPLIFQLTDGFTAQVGKNNRQNDVLTMKVAKPDDIWLHTKDIPGSHVVITTAGREPASEVILQAAHLAAYYSKSRQSTKVPVDYTRRRHVRKPSGAKPGFVIYDHQSTVYVTPDEDLINSMNKK